MFQHQNIWLPDGEKHFPEWMTKNGEMVNGRGTYQIKKFREAMKWCKRFRAAVDVGAHVGLWSMHMASQFAEVYAFEPVVQFRECWRANMAGVQNTTLHHVALGAVRAEVKMAIDPADSGGTHVEAAVYVPTGNGTVARIPTPPTPSADSFQADARVIHPRLVPLVPLDSYEFGEVDFIKIDCEGYELDVLEGAAQTIGRWKPCIIVEQKPHKLAVNYGIKGAPAVDYLLGMGAKLRKEMGGDYIMSWDD